MSAICGIVRWEKQDSNLAPSAQRMLANLRWRGPDTATLWSSDYAAFGHAALHTSSESRREKQPFLACDERYCLVLDGRIDNILELRTELQASISTDAAVVMAAFLKWGVDCASRLLGDFAFAVWDAHEGSLLCVRDRVGTKPFLWAQLPSGFAFASGLSALLTLSELSKELNEGYIGEYLVEQWTSQSDTFYRHISRLPAAHTLYVRRARHHIKRWWPTDIPAIRYKKKSDYVEHFLCVLTRVLIDHARSDAPVACDLSGGVDSSSLTVLSAELQRRGQWPAPALLSVSQLFPGFDCDESEYISAVSRVAHVENLGVACVAENSDAMLKGVALTGEPPYLATMTHRNLYLALQARQVTVRIGGDGGDELFKGHARQASALLTSGHFRAGIRWTSNAYSDQSRLFKVLHATRWMARHMLNFHSVGKFLDLELARALNKVRARSVGGFSAWLDPEFVTRTSLMERLFDAKQNEDFAHLPPFARDTLERFGTGWFAYGKEGSERVAANAKLDYRHPFHDSRILEFCAGLHWEMRDPLQPISRALLREAMGARLPPIVAQRRSKAEFSGPVFKQIQSLWSDKALFGSLLSELQLDNSMINIDRSNIQQHGAVGYGLIEIALWLQGRRGL